MTVAEPFARGQARHYPLADIARDLGARLVRDTVVRVNDDARVATTDGGRTLRYDALLLATGARSVPAYDHALTWDDRSAQDHCADHCADQDAGVVFAQLWGELADARQHLFYVLRRDRFYRGRLAARLRA